MRIVVIQASSRSKGDTFAIIEACKTHLSFDVIDLKQYNIGHYDYHHNLEDDFLGVMKKLITYDVILFATPVYWYSMSGRLKVFFDRITDCLKVDRETGRKLRGKKMGAISCSNSNDLNEGFFIPFKLSAAYLGMEYLGNIHCWIEDEISVEVQELIRNFMETIKEDLNK